MQSVYGIIDALENYILLPIGNAFKSSSVQIVGYIDINQILMCFMSSARMWAHSSGTRANWKFYVENCLQSIGNDWFQMNSALDFWSIYETYSECNKTRWWMNGYNFNEFTIKIIYWFGFAHSLKN